MNATLSKRILTRRERNTKRWKLVLPRLEENSPTLRQRKTELRGCSGKCWRKVMPHEEATRGRRIEPWELEMAKAVPDSVVRAIVVDNQNQRGPSSIAASNKPTFRDEDREPQERGTGWAKETPIRPPDGVEWVDRLCDQQDRLD